MFGCGRWFDLRTNIRDLCGTKLELRLGDPTDSFIDRRTALMVPVDAPGRGLTSGRHHFLIAAPRLSQLDSDEQAGGPAALAVAVRDAWPGEPAPPIKLLPGEVPFEQLDGESSVAKGIAIGLAERDLSPVHLDLSTEANFLVLGDTASGKSGMLRSVARRIAETYTTDQARIVMIDYRRSLLGAVQGNHLLGYGLNQTVAASLINDVATALEERLPGPGVTPEQLRNRSWWHGPDVYVLVDDYDMVATFKEHPMMPLLPYVAQAADLGLHLLIARRTGGAARGLFEPFLSRVREVGAPGLLLSGDRDEGPLLASRRAQILPPGRGWLVDRRGTGQLIQLAWSPPSG